MQSAVDGERLEEIPYFEPSEDIAESVNKMAKARWVQFKQKRDVRYLEEGISLCRMILAIRPTPHPNRSKTLFDLAGALYARFEQNGDGCSLDECVSLLREATALRPAPHPDRFSSLTALAAALMTRSQQNPDSRDLEESISFHRESLELVPAPHSGRSLSLNELANALWARFRQTGDVKDLEESIDLYKESLTLNPMPQLDRFSPLTNLANVLWTRFKLEGNFSDLEESISLNRESLSLIPVSDLRLWIPLSNLANTLWSRFEQRGDFQDLDESISLYGESLASMPLLHPNRWDILTNLGTALWTRFKQRGDLHSLEECISLHRKSLLSMPKVHSNRPISLANLANALWTRFEQNGDFQDLEESISLYGESLASVHPLHPGRCDTLTSLANALWTRFKQKGDFYDLEECISINRKSLSLMPGVHPSRSGSLNNLANSLSTRFEQKGDFCDLEECISLYRALVASIPSPHPMRSTFLCNLAIPLWTRFKQTGDPRDLDESVSLYRESLEGVATSHPNRFMPVINLANVLGTRFEQKSEFQDLEESLSLYRESLTLTPAPHPNRSSSLHNLACTLQVKFNSYGEQTDIEHALDYFEAAAKYETGSLLDRLRFSKSWAACARVHRPSLALDAYQCATDLLPLLASLDLTLEQRQNVLVHTREIIGEAASCAIEQNQLETAVTFLSTGRAVFWSQSLQLRTPVDQLFDVNPDLGEKLLMISRQLEEASHLPRVSFDSFVTSTGLPSIRTKEPLNTYALRKEWNEALDEARQIRGFEDFLLPLSFSSLRGAALRGPIVLLSTSTRGCDALVVQAIGPVVHIPLPKIRHEQLIQLKETIRLLAQGERVNSAAINDIEASMQRGLVRKAATNSNRDGFRSLLKILWLAIIEPVIRTLKLEKTDSPSKRIWWCPTGPFAFLPIHAAGIYAEGETDDCLFDYAICSYCSSPQDLLSPAPQIPTDFRMIAVIEPEAAGGSGLPKTLDELEKIRTRVPNQTHLITHVGSTDSPTCVDDVLADIRRSSIVHFGCHGVQRLHSPLESFLLLSGGKLTMSGIISECQTSGASLAYLSACETAKGDDERPDESLNLVATMTFAGFRSVVGTMWSIRDNDAPVVADIFYRHLFRHGTAAVPNVADAAYALHLAVKELRKQGAPFRNWVPFVHFGI